MLSTHDTDDTARPSRRTLARGAAWTVPVAVVGAAAPAVAASRAGNGTITGECLAGAQARFTLAVSGSAATSVQVVFTQSGSGTHTVTTPAGWTLVSSTGTVSTFNAPVSGGSAGGQVTVTYSLSGQSTGTVTATISAAPPFATGDFAASVRKVRDGSNYACTVLS